MPAASHAWLPCEGQGRSTIAGNSLDSGSTVGHGVRRVPPALRPEHGRALCPAALPLLAVFASDASWFLFWWWRRPSPCSLSIRTSWPIRAFSPPDGKGIGVSPILGAGASRTEDLHARRRHRARESLVLRKRSNGGVRHEYVALPILFRLSVPRICFAAEYPWLTVISAKGPGVGSVRAVPGERALRRDRAFSLRVRREKLKTSSSRSQLNGCLNRS